MKAFKAESTDFIYLLEQKRNKQKTPNKTQENPNIKEAGGKKRKKEKGRSGLSKEGNVADTLGGCAAIQKDFKKMDKWIVGAA